MCIYIYIYIYISDSSVGVSPVPLASESSDGRLTVCPKSMMIKAPSATSPPAGSPEDDDGRRDSMTLWCSRPE